MVQCDDLLNNSAAVDTNFSLKPNNLLFSAGETQAGRCVSDRNPWVLINSVAEAGENEQKKKIERVRVCSVTSVDKL